MREILFRGKRKVCDEWAYGFPFISRKGEYKIKWYDGYYGSSKTSEIYTESIGQYTGLTDKNGKKIFEGDIVRVCLDPEICIGEVIWDGEIASYNIPFNNGKCVLPLDIWIAKNKVGDKVWVEVIGNIHDNPELLENT